MFININECYFAIVSMLEFSTDENEIYKNSRLVAIRNVETKNENLSSQNFILFEDLISGEFYKYGTKNRDNGDKFIEINSPIIPINEFFKFDNNLIQRDRLLKILKVALKKVNANLMLNSNVQVLDTKVKTIQKK